MSAPRLVLCGLEPGPAVALAAGALLAAFADERAVRPVLLGADLPLWRLCYGCRRAHAARARPHAPGRRRRRRAVRRVGGRHRPHRHRRRRAGARPLGGRQGVARRSTSRWPSTRRSCSSSTRASAAPPSAPGCAGSSCWLAASSSPASSSSAATSRARAAGLRGLDRGRRAEAAGARLGAAAAQRAVRAAVRGRRRGAAAPDRTAAGQGRRGRAVPRGGHLPGPRRAGGCGRAPRLPAGAAAPAARAAARGRRAQAGRGLGAAARAVRARGHRPVQGAGARARARAPRARHEACRRRRRPAARRPARRGAAGRVRRQRGAQDAIAEAVADGLPTLALGGGALLLLRRLADSRGRTHELAGVLPAEAELLEWYDRPRYVQATAARENPYVQGEATLYELFDLEFLTLQQEAFAWRLGGAGGGSGGGVRARALPRDHARARRCPAAPDLAAGFVAAMRLAAPDA